MSIIKKLDRTYIIFKKRESDPRLKTMITRDMFGRPKPSYCFEQFLELFPELRQEEVAKIETEGEWRGFWTDPETGKHWGSVAALRKKTGINDWITIKRYLKKSDLEQMSVRDLVGRSTKGYRYEDFLELDEFVDFLTAPRVNEEGEWVGFLVDDAGKHWAPLGVLADYFKTESHTVGVYIKKLGLSSKNVKTRVGEIIPAFCLEDLKAYDDFVEFLNLPKVDKEGPWAGFLTDENGQHWGPILQISNKLLVHRGKIDSLIKKYPEEFQTMTVKDTKGKPHIDYCIEKIMEKMNA
jgi:hypothetical protein